MQDKDLEVIDSNNESDELDLKEIEEVEGINETVEELEDITDTEYKSPDDIKKEEKERKKKEKLEQTLKEKEQKIAEYNRYKREKDAKRTKKNQSKLKKVITYFSVFMIFLFIILAQTGTEKEVTGTMNYLKFQEDVSLNKIEKIQLVSDKSKFFTVYYKEGIGLDEVADLEREVEIIDNQRIEKVINPQTDGFLLEIINNGVEIEYLETTTIMLIITTILTILPTLLILGLFGFYMYKVLGNQLGNGGGTGEVISTSEPVLFEDVAGMTEEKEELLFALKSLTDDKLKEKGIKPVRGILLEGPPGVGKTMLAKAVAHKANVNFLSYSGSDFVEMYVGMGASRVRSMYSKAEELEPCIIFIDEIDALGRARTSAGGGATQESDQTLIALLEKMDGMNTDKKIMFIGATNRSDMLDKALIRPGRFDKIMHIGPPKTKEDREEVVAVHLKGKKLEENLTIEQVARHCYGLTGAEIAAVMNDAVMESIRADRDGVISLEDIDKATMKIFSKGLAKGRHLSSDLERVSIHELGHAIMNREVGRKVVKVSVQPYSSGVGGVTVVDSESNGITGLRKASDLRNDIKVLYAGKVAEEILLGECSIGASNDLERATLLLREYIGAYGMREGSILSLVGLARENMQITANEKLLTSMEELGQEIYQEVVEVISRERNKEHILKLTEKLKETEVIYNFDEVIEELENK